jgi:hypothetical protein
MHTEHKSRNLVPFIAGPDCEKLHGSYYSLTLHFPAAGGPVSQSPASPRQTNTGVCAMPATLDLPCEHTHAYTYGILSGSRTTTSLKAQLEPVTRE